MKSKPEPHPRIATVRSSEDAVLGLFCKDRGFHVTLKSEGVALKPEGAAKALLQVTAICFCGARGALTVALNAKPPQTWTLSE